MRYLENYQPFITKKELNDAVSTQLNRHQYKLNETDRDVLLMLSRYAVKYPGVAHLKLSTIAQALNKSTRTIRRSSEKLENLKVIERKLFSREKSGGQGANLYVFLDPSVRGDMSAGQQATNPVPAKDEGTISETEPISLLSKEHCIYNTYQQESITHYTRFKNNIKSFTGEDNQEQARKLYGIYRAQTLRLLKFSIHEDKRDLFEALSLQAITITYQTTKKKRLDNIFGYYDGVLRNLIDKAVFLDAFMDYDVGVEFKVMG